LPRLLDDRVRKQVQARYNSLQDYGGFSYTDERVLGPEDIHFTYLRVRVENEPMIGSWEVKAGDTIMQGLDAPVPSKVSDPITPSLRYSIHITATDWEDPVNRDFEVTESPDIQDDYVLLEGLESGKTYTIRATMNAAYYVDGKKHTFTSSVNPHIVKN